jgi:hypothetical protein
LEVGLYYVYTKAAVDEYTKNHISNSTFKP